MVDGSISVLYAAIHRLDSWEKRGPINMVDGSISVLYSAIHRLDSRKERGPINMVDGIVSLLYSAVCYQQVEEGVISKW